MPTPEVFAEPTASRNFFDVIVDGFLAPFSESSAQAAQPWHIALIWALVGYIVAGVLTNRGWTTKFGFFLWP